jgi:hypothetical protein
MKDAILIFDRLLDHQPLLGKVQNKTNVPVFCYEDSLVFQIDCLKSTYEIKNVFINPHLPVQQGKPSAVNLIHFLGIVRPSIKIHLIFDSLNQLEFFKKNILSPASSYLCKPLNIQDVLESTNFIEDIKKPDMEMSGL